MLLGYYLLKLRADSGCWIYFKAQSLSQSSKIQLNSDSELGIKGKKKWTKEEILQNKENTICQRHDSWLSYCGCDWDWDERQNLLRGGRGARRVTSPLGGSSQEAQRVLQGMGVRDGNKLEADKRLGKLLKSKHLNLHLLPGSFWSLGFGAHREGILPSEWLQG